MIVTAYNPSVANLEKSYLSRAYSAGVTSLQVRNNDKFEDDAYLQIGESGQENTEIVKVTNTSGANSVTLTAATLFPHSASDPIYVLRYNQIKFYRSTTTIDGSYSAVATLAIDVDNETLRTDYDDPTGITSYFYKIAFFNDETNVESSLSDPIAGEGYDRKQVGTLVNSFLTEVGDLQQEYITIPTIFSLLNEVNEDVIGQSRRPYRFLRTFSLATVNANDDRVPLPDNLVRLDRIKYTNINNVVVTVANKDIISIEEMEYKQYNQFNIPAAFPANITKLAIDETTNEIVIFPKPTTTQADSMKIYYWSEFDVITSLADRFQPPVARLYKMFLLGRFYRMRAKKDNSYLDLSDRYLSDYNSEIVKLQRAQKIDVGTPMSFKPDVGTARGLRR